MKFKLLYVLVIVNTMGAMNLADEEKMNDMVHSLYNNITALAVKTPTIYFPGHSPFVKVWHDLLGFNQFNKLPSYLKQIENLEQAVLVDFPESLNRERKVINENAEQEGKEFMVYGLLAIGLFSLGYSRYTNGSSLLDCSIKRGLSCLGGIVSGFLCCISFKTGSNKNKEFTEACCRISSYENYKLRLKAGFDTLKSYAPISPISQTINKNSK